MTDGERDPAESDLWPLGKMIRRAMLGWKSYNAVAKRSAEMGPDYEFSRFTLRNYADGRRQDGGALVVTADMVRRIAAVLELDPREALEAAGITAEADRHPPRSLLGAPLDTPEVIAGKLRQLLYEEQAAVQTIVNGLIAARTGGQPEPDVEPAEEHVRVVSSDGGAAWRGHKSFDGHQSEVPASERLS
jgi:hypothetical protein